MTEPLVSICIPTYNGALYLKECIDSCIAQSYGSFEILVCDDGSTDGTQAILENYASRHKQIRVYYNEKNLGLVGNWNRCLELAKGEWIKFVFQDDYITRECLAEFVKGIKSETRVMTSRRNFVLPKNPSDEILNYYTHIVRTIENTCPQSSPTYSKRTVSRAAVQNLGMNFIAEPSLIFFRKDAVNEVGSFEPLLKQICDLEFVLRLASSYGLEYVNQPLCAFRIHPESATNTNVTSKYFDLKFIEPVLYSWILLHKKAFQKFRNELSVFQKFKLELYFRLKAFKAFKENQQSGRKHPVFEKKNSEFAVIQKAARGNLFISILSVFLSR